jgi:hypothetical protein
MSDLYATDAARELAELGASAQQVMSDLARWRQAGEGRMVTVQSRVSTASGAHKDYVELADPSGHIASSVAGSLLEAACAALWYWNKYYPGEAFTSGLVYLIPRRGGDA